MQKCVPWRALLLTLTGHAAEAPDPALDASSSEDEGCFDRPGRGGDDSDVGDALDESAFVRGGNALAKQKKKFTNAYDRPTDTAPSRPRGGGGPKKGYTGGPLPAGWEPVWHEPASGKGGKWKFEHAIFGIVDSRAQAEQFDTKRAGPMNSWLEKKKKLSASPATADGPRASTKRPRRAVTPRSTRSRSARVNRRGRCRRR